MTYSFLKKIHGSALITPLIVAALCWSITDGCAMRSQASDPEDDAGTQGRKGPGPQPAVLYKLVDHGDAAAARLKEREEEAKKKRDEEYHRWLMQMIQENLMRQYAWAVENGLLPAPNKSRVTRLHHTPTSLAQPKSSFTRLPIGEASNSASSSSAPAATPPVQSVMNMEILVGRDVSQISDEVVHAVQQVAASIQRQVQAALQEEADIARRLKESAQQLLQQAEPLGAQLQKFITKQENPPLGMDLKKELARYTALNKEANQQAVEFKAKEERIRTLRTLVQREEAQLQERSRTVVEELAQHVTDRVQAEEERLRQIEELQRHQERVDLETRRRAAIEAEEREIREAQEAAALALVQPRIEAARAKITASQQQNVTHLIQWAAQELDAEKTKKARASTSYYSASYLPPKEQFNKLVGIFLDWEDQAMQEAIKVNFKAQNFKGPKAQQLDKFITAVREEIQKRRQEAEALVATRPEELMQKALALQNTQSMVYYNQTFQQKVEQAEKRRQEEQVRLVRAQAELEALHQKVGIQDTRADFDLNRNIYSAMREEAQQTVWSMDEKVRALAAYKQRWTTTLEGLAPHRRLASETQEIIAALEIALDTLNARTEQEAAQANVRRQQAEDFIKPTHLRSRFSEFYRFNEVEDGNALERHLRSYGKYDFQGLDSKRSEVEEISKQLMTAYPDRAEWYRAKALQITTQLDDLRQRMEHEQREEERRHHEAAALALQRARAGVEKQVFERAQRERTLNADGSLAEALYNQYADLIVEENKQAEARRRAESQRQQTHVRHHVPQQRRYR